MHKNHTDKQAVPSRVYDETYYLTDCADYDLYKSHGGLRVSERLAGVLTLADLKEGHVVLDIGCGRGELLVQAALRGARAIGIDYSEDAVRLCRENQRRAAPSLKVPYRVERMDAKNLAFADGSFDVVFMTDVVEHLHDWELDQVFAEVARVLRPAGQLILHTAPNRWYLNIAHPYYIRWINTLARGLARRLVRDPDLDEKLPTRKELRSEYELVMHVNEQTYYSLRGRLRKFFAHVAVTPFFYVHDRRWMFRAYDVAAKLYPLGTLWPWYLLFADAFYAVANGKK
jgi:SAM-dependent methyltransferase